MISHKELNRVVSFDDFLEKSIFTRDAKIKLLKDFDDRLAEKYTSAIQEGISKSLYDTSELRLWYGESEAKSKLLSDMTDFSELPLMYQLKLMKFNNILESFLESIYQLYDSSRGSCLTIDTRVDIKLFDDYSVYSYNRQSPGPKDVASSVVVRIKLEHNERYTFYLHTREQEGFIERLFNDEKVNENVVYYTRVVHSIEDSSLVTTFEDDVRDAIPLAQTDTHEIIDIAETLRENYHESYEEIIKAILEHVESSVVGKDAYKKRLVHINRIVDNETRIEVDDIDVDKELGINEIEIVEVVEESPKHSKSRFF